MDDNSSAPVPLPAPGREVELKLLVDGGSAERFLAAELLATPQDRQSIRTIYYDTVDADLRAAGFILRVRAAGGAFKQTVKAAGSQTAGLFARPEWEQTVPGPAPMIDDTTPLKIFLGARLSALAPVFEVRVERRTWLIEEGEATCELVLDCGSVIAGDRSTPVCEFELELRSGPARSLFDLARRIDAIAPVRPGLLTKAERGFRLLGPAREVTRSEKPDLSPDMTSAVAFQRIAAACIRQFGLNEALIDPTFPDALHQARIGLRRLRSAMKVHKAMLADERFAAISADLAWLAGVLGHARDLDVVARHLDDAALAQARSAAYDTVHAELASDRTRRLLLDLSEWLSTGAWLTRPETATLRQEPVRDSSAAILSRLRKKVRKAGRNLTELSDEDRHTVRKTAKKLRYTAEFFAPLFDDKRGRRRRGAFFAAIEQFQDHLGALNDMANLPSTLEGIGIAPPADLAPDPERRKAMLDAAEAAHSDLSDTKAFWR